MSIAELLVCGFLSSLRSPTSSQGGSGSSTGGWLEQPAARFWKKVSRLTGIACMLATFPVRFMSTTTDKAVAIHYGQDWDAKRGLSYVMEFVLDSLNRGAMIRWISQYPAEAEVLFAPLTGMELIKEGAIYTNGQSMRHLHFRLTCNQHAIKIEDLVAVRKNQCAELADVVMRGLKVDLEKAAEGSINHAWCLGLQVEAESKAKAITGQEAEAFNNNVHFTAEVIETVTLVPKVFGRWSSAVGVKVFADGLLAEYAQIVAGAYAVDPTGPTANARPHLRNGVGGHIYATAGGDWVLNCVFTPGHASGVALIEAAGGSLPIGRREWRGQDGAAVHLKLADIRTAAEMEEAAAEHAAAFPEWAGNQAAVQQVGKVRPLCPRLGMSASRPVHVSTAVAAAAAIAGCCIAAAAHGRDLQHAAHSQRLPGGCVRLVCSGCHLLLPLAARAAGGRAAVRRPRGRPVSDAAWRLHGGPGAAGGQWPAALPGGGGRPPILLPGDRQVAPQQQQLHPG